jgi:hypothetical protein
MDYRLKQNRREAFIRWYIWSLEYKDCDPAIWMANYIFDRFEFNIEQRYWLCWLYGNTYYYPTAFILWNEFPDFELASIDRIENWNTQNYRILRYQTDTKYNKGHLPSMYESYMKVIGNKDQKDLFYSLLQDNETKSYQNISKFVNEKFYKFGRYTTWFYLQSLKYCCGLPIQADSLLLKDYSGSRSHRNGLLYVLGQEDNIDVKLSQSEYDRLENEATSIMEECRSRFPHLSTQIEPFTMETCLCSFKKLFRTTNGRYLGYYLDRQAEEIQKVQKDGWYGIDWNVLWQARSEILNPGLDLSTGIKKEKFHRFLESGSIEKLDWLFKDETKQKIGLEEFYD